MTKYSGRVIGRSGADTLLQVETPVCASCGSCEKQGERSLVLKLADFNPESDVVGLTLSEAAQISLLWNSLILPVFCLVAGAAVAALFGGGDGSVFLAGITGFGCGVLACRRITMNRLKLDEVFNQ